MAHYELYNFNNNSRTNFIIIKPSIIDRIGFKRSCCEVAHNAYSSINSSPASSVHYPHQSLFSSLPYGNLRRPSCRTISPECGSQNGFQSKQSEVGMYKYSQDWDHFLDVLISNKDGDDGDQGREGKGRV
jgi:hypothetical protein